MGGQKFEVPDWRQYKVEGVPELERLQRLLANHNLKDPWIRNEVWRYHPGEYTSSVTNMKRSVFRGFKYAVAAMAVTILVEKLQEKYGPPKDHGHH